MNAPAHLDPADRAQVEQVLRRALETPEIRASLRRYARHHPETNAEVLYTEALAELDALHETAEDEYATYHALRLAADRAAHDAAVPPPGGKSSGGQGFLAALTVLAPVLSTVAAAIFLLLGYVFEAAGATTSGAALIRAGWYAAALAALSTLIAVIGLIGTAARHRAAPHGPEEPDRRALTAAREAWRRALLERGALPFLRERLPLPEGEDPRTEAAETKGRRRPGFASPDFSGPDYASPGYAAPDFSSPDFSSPDFSSPDFSSPARPFDK